LKITNNFRVSLTCPSGTGWTSAWQQFPTSLSSYMSRSHTPRHGPPDISVLHLTLTQNDQLRAACQAISSSTLSVL